MQISKLELEQMARDGKGRASAVKALAEAALKSTDGTIQIELEEKTQLYRALKIIAEKWPNTFSNIMVKAAELTQKDARAASHLVGSGGWVRFVLHWLPKAIDDDKA